MTLRTSLHDFLGCIRNKLTLELCKIFKCDVSCCKLQIHMEGSKMALTNSWNSETRKPANLCRKRTSLMKTLDLIFQCFDSFSDPSLRRTKWKMEFTITACRGCSLHMNSQSFPGERSRIKFSVAHHTSQEVNDDNEASTSAVCILETKYNWTSLRFVTTSAQADCQIWLSSCKHLNVRLQFQKVSQLYIPHLWKSDHEAVVREIKHLALGSGWDMARSLHLTWTAACANTTTAAGSQWFQGWKHGNQVYLGCVHFNMQCKLRDGKKHGKKTIIQGRAVYIRLPGSPAPRGFGALTQNSDLIRYRDPVPAPNHQGALEPQMISNWSAIQMTWRCF